MTASFRQRTAISGVALGTAMTILVLLAGINDGFSGNHVIALIPFAGFAALAVWGWRSSWTWMSLASVAWLFGGLALLRVPFAG